MYKWRVTIEIWPFSGTTQENAGQRKNDFIVLGESMATAFEKADLIAMGMRTNPKVWRAPIVSIAQVEHLQEELASKSSVNQINKQMEEALKFAHAIMTNLRQALHDEPAVRGREWIPQATDLNDAIQKVHQALPSKE